MSSLTIDRPCGFVLPQTDELRMTEVVVSGPLKEVELTDEYWLQSHALGHLGLGEPLAPSATPRLWKIGERALVDLEPLELLEQLHALRV